MFQNQMHFFGSIFDSSAKEADKHFSIHAAFVKHKAEFTLIGDARDHVDFLILFA
jgi:hypothetical protein